MSEFQAKLIDALRASTSVTTSFDGKDREHQLLTLATLQTTVAKEGVFVFGYLKDATVVTKRMITVDLTQTIKINKAGYSHVWYLDTENAHMSVGVLMRFTRHTVQDLTFEHVEAEKQNSVLGQQLKLLQKYDIPADQLESFKNDFMKVFNAED